jgi:hypothetical protein
METPVAFLIFNRPETTKRDFNEIARARPKKLLVVADGPRADVAGEAETCSQTRAVLNSIDWNCELLINFSDENLGCEVRVSSGLDWVFDQVEEAIVLEDDCLPHPSFFPFCEELLHRYRDDPRVMSINGDFFLEGYNNWNESYYFTRYQYIWGWASWRRARRAYDVQLKKWEGLKHTKWLKDTLRNKDAAQFWGEVFESVIDGRAKTWDYQWLFACWEQNGYSISPTVNLVSNIGFGENATHTTAANANLANLPTKEMRFPLIHPKGIDIDQKAENFALCTILNCPPLQEFSRAAPFACCKNAACGKEISIVFTNMNSVPSLTPTHSRFSVSPGF